MLEANASTATRNVSSFTDSDSICVCLCAFEAVCGCQEWSFCFGHLQFSGLAREASLLRVHKSTGCVNGCVGVAIESLECVVRNDAQREREEPRQEGERAGYPQYSQSSIFVTIFCHEHFLHDFSSPSLYQHPSQSAAREKINFLLPDYIIRFRLDCQLNIPHQHFIKQGVAWYRGVYSKTGLWVQQGRPAL